MRTFLVLFIGLLVFADIPQMEARHQITNFMKFLQIMKSKGWDKDLIDASTFLPQNLKSRSVAELEPTKQQMKYKDSGSEGTKTYLKSVVLIASAQLAPQNHLTEDS